MKTNYILKTAMVLYFCIVGTLFSYGVKYEAELATFGGETWIGDSDAGFSGTGYLRNFNDVGSYVEFAITGASAGAQNIFIHYTTGQAGSLNLYVNGALVGPVAIPTTGGWSNWQDYAINVTLNEGNNTIKFIHEASNTGNFFYYVDYLTVAGLSAVSSVSVSPQTLSITDYSSSQLTATVLPADAPNKTVTWSSSNTTVASVNANGLVFGKSAGNATITATTQDGSKTATCEVTVTASNAPKYEAELATLTGLNLTTDQAGYSGSGFVNAFADEGNNLQFSVSVASAGSYKVVLGFATGTGIPLDLYVNDVLKKQIVLANTGGWGNWEYHVETVTLNEGNNTIKYQKGSGYGYLNADYIVLLGPVPFTSTAYRWSGNVASTSNDNRVLAPGLNDQDLTTDLRLSGLNSGEPVPNAYEAAGLIFNFAKTINKVEFINGAYGGGNDDGSFEADFKLQITTDGTTWTDATGWTLSPAYEYLNVSVSGTTFTFTGSATDVLGLRVTGKVRTSEVSGSWDVRAREITAYFGPLTEVSGSVQESGISLSQNPFSKGSLLIKLPEGATQLSILDITGRTIYQTQVTRNDYLINESVFRSNGIYIVNVLTAKGSKNQKLIVKK